MGSETGIPLSVYITVLAAFILTGMIGVIFPDLSLNIIAEIIGAILTLFIIDRLILNDKRKKWLIVKDEIEYLLARIVNRLRQKIAEQIFFYKPDFKAKDQKEFEHLIREDREKWLRTLSAMSDKELLRLINKKIFTGDLNEYFEERAEELWKIMNMKYADYFPPAVVQNVIELVVTLRDLCSYVRIYQKTKTYKDEKKYYKRSGEEGVIFSIRKIINLLIELKRLGYSEVPKKE